MKVKNLPIILITASISLFTLTWLFSTNTFAVLTCEVTSKGPYWIGGSFEIKAYDFIHPDSNYVIRLEKDPDRIVQRDLETFVPRGTKFPLNVLLSSPLKDPEDQARWFVRIVELTSSRIPDANKCDPATITIEARPPSCPDMDCTFSEIDPDPDCASGLREVTGTASPVPGCPGPCCYVDGCSRWTCYVAPPESCTVTRDSETSWTVTGSGLIAFTDYNVLLNKIIYGGQTTDSKGDFRRTGITPFKSGSFTVDLNQVGSAKIINCGTIDCPLCGGAPGKNPCKDLDGDGIPECPTAIGNIPFDMVPFARRILQIGIGLSGGIVLILMVIGSIRVVTSSGDQQKLNGGRDMIIAAVFGLLFLIFSVMILRFIGFNIVGL